MNTKGKIFSSIAILGSAVFAMVLTAGTGLFETLGLINSKTTKATEIVLDKSNAYANGDTSKYILTNVGNNPIEFQYSGCTALSQGHATLSENGTIGNYRLDNRPDDGVLWNNKITGIQSIYPVFTVSPETATLKFKASYNGSNWGDYAALTSGVAFDLNSSKPNYVEVKAIGGRVALTSLKLTYTCVAEEHSEIPVYHVELKTSDAKQNTYFVGESFSSFVGNGGLVVSAKESTGSTVALASSEYTYKVYNSSEQEVTGAFTSSGTYKVVVSSTSLGDVTYNITVSTRPVTNISVSPSSANLVINSTETVQLSATVTPSNATDPTYTWSSSNTNVATVSINGLVTAVGNGNARITATANDGFGASGYSDISVSTWTPKMYQLVEDESDLNKGDVIVIYAPGSQRAMAKTYNSYMDSVAVTLRDGYIIENSDILELTLGEGASGHTDKYSLYCEEDSTTYYLYNASDYGLKLGSTLAAAGSWDITVYNDNTAGIVADNNNEYKTINFNPSNNTFYTTNGFATDGDVAIYRLVSDPIAVTGITLSEEEITIAPGNTHTLVPTVAPSDATNKTITWESLNEGIATVDNGVVTGVSDGDTTITATTVDGNFIASCTVHVATVHVTGVSLNKTNANLAVGSSTSLTATVAPENAADTSVTWSTDSDTVATVNPAGIVTGHQSGTATITATTTDGGYTASCTVRVTNVDATNVGIINAAGGDLPTEIEVGSTLSLEAVVLPENTTFKTVSWSSSDTSIATINEDGVVTARSEGDVVITVLTDYGNVSNTYSLHIAAAGSIAVQKTDNVMFTDKNWNAQINGVSESWSGGDVYGYVSGQGLQVTSSYSGVSCTSPDSYTNVSKVEIQYCTNASKGSGSVSVSVGDISFGTVATVGTGTNLRTMEFTPSSSKATRAKANGQVRFVVNCSANSVYIASCSVTYVVGGGGGGEETIVNVNGISVNPTTASLTVGGHQQLEASIIPSDATNQNYSWTSSNNSVATISSSGYVTAISAGNATMTATSEDGGFTATCIVTVSAATINVTGVSLNPTTASIKVDGNIKLAATVSPSDATNKAVTWSSSNSGVAAVSDTGVVSGVSAGTATITVKTVDGNKTATCSVKVTENSSSATGEFIINTSNATDKYTSGTTEKIGGYDIVFNQVGTSYTSGYMQFKRNQGYIYNSDSIAGLYSLLLDCGSKSFSGTLYSGSSLDDLSHTQTVNGSGTYSIPAGDTFFKIASGDGTYYIISITVSYSTEPIDPTGLSIPSSKEMSVGETYAVPVTLSPTGANQHKGITWSVISGANFVEVSTSGVITAKAPGTATVQATLYEISPTISKQITITVNEKQADKWTWLVYMCGADLESGSGHYATSDLNEIYSIKSRLPDNMNIVVEAGGAKSWASTFTSVIDKSKLSRFHLTKSGYVSDGYVSKASMGLQSTLASFVQWGLETYPADNVGLIFWNHGGAMDGVCFDENYSDDSLTTSEINGALKTAMTNSHYSKGKLEVIGYDACLMAVQDYAGMTADYCNNMVCSEESESGSGWDYDTWLTTNINQINNSDCTNLTCKSICDSFLSEQGSGSDQTLSHIDLTKWDAYETAFENFASAINSYVGSTQSKYTEFKNAVNQAQKYGLYDGYEQYNDGYVYDIFDIGDVMNKLKSKYSGQSSITNAITSVQNAYTNNLIHYETHGRKAGNSTGLALVLGVSGINNKSCYASGTTTLTTWRSFAYTWWNK